MYYYFLWSQKWVVKLSNLAIYFQCSKCKTSKVNIRFWCQCRLPFAVMFCNYYQAESSIKSNRYRSLPCFSGRMSIVRLQWFRREGWKKWQQYKQNGYLINSVKYMTACLRYYWGNWQSKSWCANNPQCDPQGIKLLTLFVTDMQPGYMTSSYPQLTANWYITSFMIAFLLLRVWR